MKHVILFLVVALAGCERVPSARFATTSLILIALDTKTGQLCRTYPIEGESLMRGVPIETLPLCKDLPPLR